MVGGVVTVGGFETEGEHRGTRAKIPHDSMQLINGSHELGQSMSGEHGELNGQEHVVSFGQGSVAQQASAQSSKGSQRQGIM